MSGKAKETRGNDRREPRRGEQRQEYERSAEERRAEERRAEETMRLYDSMRREEPRSGPNGRIRAKECRRGKPKRQSSEARGGDKISWGEPSNVEESKRDKRRREEIQVEESRSEDMRGEQSRREVCQGKVS